MRLEKQLTKKINEYLWRFSPLNEEADDFIYRYKVSDRFTAGIPDFLLCKDGKFLALELKSDKGKQSEIQKYVEKQIRKAGGEYLCTNSYEEAVKWISSC